MLDAIIDVRTPRILLILRNAFGGAYASFNNYSTGADVVLALPTTRVAVMGPAGTEFVYKDALRGLRRAVPKRVAAATAERTAAGMSEDAALKEAEAEVMDWLRQEEQALQRKYERELMNPREALSLGSISKLVMPTELRQSLVKNFDFLMRHYQPGPMTGVQREFH